MKESRIIIRVVAIVVLGLLSASVLAQSTGGNYEVTPFGAFSIGGTFSDAESAVEAELQDSGSFGLLFDIREGSNTQWEILYAQQRTDADIVGAANGEAELDMRIHHLQIGGTYQGDGERIRPYLAATLGAAHYDVLTAGYDSDTFFSFSIGPGLQIRPSSRVGLRLEARLFGSWVQSDSRLFCISDPGGGNAGCALLVSGEILWQVQAMAGVVVRF
ncbi:MAG: porin family protein [Gammaproteobacteria bacterium]|nr:porin family protein [Gammaproteobacteria bacterium]